MTGPERPHRLNISWPQAPGERLVLVEHYLMETMDTQAAIMERLDKMDGRLKIIDFITEIASAFREPAVQSLQRAVAWVFNVTLLYIAARVLMAWS